MSREFPNLKSLAQGALSGRISDWPLLQAEARIALQRIEQLEVELQHQLTLCSLALKALREYEHAYLSFEEVHKPEEKIRAALKGRTATCRCPIEDWRDVGQPGTQCPVCKGWF